MNIFGFEEGKDANILSFEMDYEYDPSERVTNIRHRFAEEIRQEVGGEIRNIPQLNTDMETILDFIENPQSLHIDLNPPTPLGMADMFMLFLSPDNIATRIGLTIRAN